MLGFLQGGSRICLRYESHITNVIFVRVFFTLT
jgi:hypothetical protein